MKQELRAGVAGWGGIGGALSFRDITEGFPDKVDLGWASREEKGTKTFSS